MIVTSVRCECLRGVWLGNTGPSLPRLFPNPLSAPTTPTETNIGRDLTLETLGSSLGQKSYLSQTPGKHRHDRILGDIMKTECYVLSVLSPSRSAPLGVPRSLFETRGWGGMQVHQGSSHPPFRAAPPGVQKHNSNRMSRSIRPNVHGHTDDRMS